MLLFDAIQAGAVGSEVYDVCCDVLEKAGYETTRGWKKGDQGNDSWSWAWSGFADT